MKTEDCNLRIIGFQRWSEATKLAALNRYISAMSSTSEVSQQSERWWDNFLISESCVLVVWSNIFSKNQFGTIMLDLFPAEKTSTVAPPLFPAARNGQDLASCAAAFAWAQRRDFRVLFVLAEEAIAKAAERNGFGRFFFRYLY